MADVTLVIKADNTQYVNKVKEAQREHQKLTDQVNDGAKKRIGFIEQEEKRIQRLTEMRRKSYTQSNIEFYNKELERAKKNLNDLETAGLKVEKSGNSMIQTLGKWALGFTTVTTAITVFKKILNSTDALSDKFKATLNGWKEGFAAMARAIANNDFENFFKNVKTAVAEGQRYAETEDKIGNSARAMKIRIKENETELIKLREIQNDATKSNEKRLEAGLEAEKIVKANAKDRIDLAQMVYDNDIRNAAFISKQSDEVVKNYLRQEPVLMRQIELGNQYNDLIEQRDALLIESSGAGYNLIDQKAVGIIQDKIDAMGSEAVAYGDLATGLSNLTDTVKNKITTDLEEIEISKQSAINLRVSSRVDAMKAKGVKELSDVTKDYIDDLILMNKWTEEYFDKEEKRNKEINDKINKDKEEQWQFGLKISNLLFKQNKDQAKRDWDLLLENNKKQEAADEELLKMKSESLQKMGESVLDYISIIEELTAGESERTQREREILDTRVSEAQDALDTEVDLYKAGYASNVDAKKKEVEEIKKQRDKALKEEEDARKKQHQIEVASLVAQKVVDIAKIISSTAVANAKAVAASPLTLGQPWVAINTASAALAIAATIAAVISASQAKYAKGGWTGKGTIRDETGQKIAGVTHEEEFVVKKGPASKHRKLLEKINNDEYITENITVKNRFREALEAINKEDRSAVYNSFLKLKPELVGGTTNVLVENNGPNNRLDRINNQLTNLNRSMTARKQTNEEVFQSPGVMIIRKGNNTRVIRK